MYSFFVFLSFLHFCPLLQIQQPLKNQNMLASIQYKNSKEIPCGPITNVLYVKFSLLIRVHYYRCSYQQYIDFSAELELCNTVKQNFLSDLPPISLTQAICGPVKMDCVSGSSQISNIIHGYLGFLYNNNKVVTSVAFESNI